jgi:hypothetical protein
MANLIDKLIGLLALPVMILNFAGLIVGGGWLLFLGQWKVVLASAALAFFGNHLLMWPMLLSLVFAIPGKILEQRGWHGLLKVLAVFSGLYTITVMTLWAAGSLVFFVKESSRHDTMIPFLLCSYAVATSPWQGMAQKEASGVYGFNPSQTLAGYLSMSYVVALVATYLEVPLITPLIIIAGGLLAGLAVNLKTASDIQKFQKRYGIQ